MAHWEPQADGLNQIITLLKQSQSTDNQIQRNVQLVGHIFFLRICWMWHHVLIYTFITIPETRRTQPLPRFQQLPNLCPYQVNNPG